MPISKTTIRHEIEKSKIELKETDDNRMAEYWRGNIAGLNDLIADKNLMDVMMIEAKNEDLPDLRKRFIKGYRDAFVLFSKNKRGGRPKIFSERTVMIGIRIPESLAAKIPKPHNKTIRDVLIAKFK
jgi:hypothetical protein